MEFLLEVAEAFSRLRFTGCRAGVMLEGGCSAAAGGAMFDVVDVRDDYMECFVLDIVVEVVEIGK